MNRPALFIDIFVYSAFSRTWVCFWKLIFWLHVQESFTNCMMSCTLLGPNWNFVNCMIRNQNYLNNHDRYTVVKSDYWKLSMDDVFGLHPLYNFQVLIYLWIGFEMNWKFRGIRTTHEKETLNEKATKNEKEPKWKTINEKGANTKRNWRTFEKELKNIHSHQKYKFELLKWM